MDVSPFFVIVLQRITLKLSAMIQSNEPLSFDSLPKAVSTLIKEVGEMKSMLQAVADRNGQPEREWMTLDELILYLPGKPAKQTIYCWVSKKNIPFHKAGQKLQFLKSEIDAWMMGETTFTNDEDDVDRVPLKARKAPSPKKGSKK